MVPKKYYIPQVEKVHEVSDTEISAAPKTILVLEDDPAIADLFTQYLQFQSFRVMVAKDGLQGLRQVMHADYDVIICDMMMPNLAGDMFYKAVERIKPHMAKRFLFITGYSSDARIKAFITSIKGLILYKPIDMHLLLENITLILKKNDLAAAARSA